MSCKSPLQHKYASKNLRCHSKFWIVDINTGNSWIINLYVIWKFCFSFDIVLKREQDIFSISNRAFFFCSKGGVRNIIYFHYFLVNGAQVGFKFSLSVWTVSAIMKTRAMINTDFYHHSIVTYGHIVGKGHSRSSISSLITLYFLGVYVLVTNHFLFDRLFKIRRRTILVDKLLKTK